MASIGPNWPAVSIEEAYKILTAPGAPFEMTEVMLHGEKMRVYKNAPPNLRFIFEMGRNWGKRDFIVYQDERLTYEDHYRAAVTFGRALIEKYGVVKGDRVALAMRNYPEWAIAFWATVAIGGVVVPVNAWGTGPELEYTIADSGAKVLVLDSERLERLEPHLQGLDLAGIVAVRMPGRLPASIVAMEDIIGPREGYSGLPDTPLPQVDIHPDDNATLLYTSGTTGKPKGALCAHRHITNTMISMGFNTARGAVRRGEPIPVMDISVQRVALLSVPLFHVTGTYAAFVPAYASGSKIVMMHKWNPEKALELIEKERVNLLGGVPSIAWQLIESPEFDKWDTSSIDTVSYGGAPAAPELVTRICQKLPKVQPATGYGMTEAAGVVSQNSAEDYIKRPDSCGIPIPLWDVKVVDEQGRELPPGSAGELWVKSPLVFKGYWNRPAETAATITDGWLHTGDIVKVDEEGFIYILDRAKDMLIRGGENIYCVEVEDALYSHPCVMDAAVIGIPHKVLGEEVGAVVQVIPGKDVNEDILKTHVAGQLAAFKVPVKIELRHEPLPRNAAGKILKSVLREEFKKIASDAA